VVCAAGELLAAWFARFAGAIQHASLELGGESLNRRVTASR